MRPYSDPASAGGPPGEASGPPSAHPPEHAAALRVERLMSHSPRPDTADEELRAQYRELQTALKELAMVNEELRAQNEALARSLAGSQAERQRYLDNLGLAGAVVQLAEEEKRRAGWEDVELLHNVAGLRFDSAVETAVYRFVQEALTNARKHANTGRVRVSLILSRGDEGAGLRAEVRDWGVGFDPAARPAGYSQVGLRSMAESMRLLGGRCDIATAPGQGAAISAAVPILPGAAP